MSLDVYLRVPGLSTRVASRILIRKDGRTVEVSRDEWDRTHPGREPVVMLNDSEDDCVYSGNITHNLVAMAKEAGLYQLLWNPQDNGITHAHQLIGPLLIGLEVLKSDPARFEVFNPKNGWGDYEGFVSFVSEYLAACDENPPAEVSVSR